MKGLEKLKTFINIGNSMIDEAKESEPLKEAKLILREDLDKLTILETTKKLLKDLLKVHKARKQAVEEMLNSDEADFIKMAIRESDKFKKASDTLEKIGDMLPKKLKREFLDYKHWILNWSYIIRMTLKAPLPVIKGILKYPWIFDLTKSIAMTGNQIRNREGANVTKMRKQLSFIIKDVCYMLEYTLSNPDKVVIKQVMIPGEIVQAMGLYFMVPEIQGTIIPKCDQFTGLKYLDATESAGLPQDTCSYPRFAGGVALMDEMPPGSCMIASNLPCDGGMSSYEAIQKKLGDIPTYRLNVPYDFRNDESIDAFADDLKEMIKFLEKHTGHKMEWDALREQCNNYNRMVEAELERWELAKLDNPPLSNDTLWYPHEWHFNLASGRKDAADFHEELLRLDKKALEKGEPSFYNMRYRTIMWNPPPAFFGPIWTWFENCWGVGSVMDLETYGHIEYIDTSTPETMLRGLGKRYMWATMARHTRGPAENMLDDFRTVIEEFRPDFVFLPAHVGCKNGMSLENNMREICRQMDMPFCVVRYELIDNRVASRQSIRDQFSKFMTEIMHAEPLDPSLLRADDVVPGCW